MLLIGKRTDKKIHAIIGAAMIGGTPDVVAVSHNMWYPRLKTLLVLPAIIEYLTSSTDHE